MVAGEGTGVVDDIVGNADNLAAAPLIVGTEFTINADADGAGGTTLDVSVQI